MIKIHSLFFGKKNKILFSLNVITTRESGREQYRQQGKPGEYFSNERNVEVGVFFQALITNSASSE